MFVQIFNPDSALLLGYTKTETNMTRRGRWKKGFKTNISQTTWPTQNARIVFHAVILSSGQERKLSLRKHHYFYEDNA